MSWPGVGMLGWPVKTNDRYVTPLYSCRRVDLAGALKAVDPNKFSGHVDGFRLLTPPISSAMALYLPWLEMVTGAAMFFKTWRTAASILIGGMLVIFFLALSSALVRQLDVTCGCFGNVLGISNYYLSLLIDIALFIALCVTMVQKNELSQADV